HASSASAGAEEFWVGLGSFGCTVSDAGLVHITGAAVGTDFCVIKVSQDETANYTAAGPVSDSFHIAKADPGLTLDLSGVSATYGDSDFSVASHASSASAGAKHFSLGLGSFGCTVSDAGLVHITGAAVGTDFCVLEVRPIETANYTAAGPVSDS